MTSSILLGAGEIGSAYYQILKPHYPTWRVDILPEKCDIGVPDKIDILHVCLRYSDKWESIVHDAIDRFEPKLINVMTTTPPGTTEILGPRAVHSSSRGLHPALEKFIRATPKHISGPRSKDVAAYFEACGIRCITHDNPRTTEIAHILSNAAYGINAIFADEQEKICRHFGVDYYSAVQRYAESHNEGYGALGYVSKFRPIMSPAGGKIGGHCVQQGANLIPAELRGPLLQRLAEYGV